MTFNRVQRSFSGGRRGLQQMVLGPSVWDMQESETGPQPEIVYKMNSKWINDLNVRVQE